MNLKSCLIASLCIIIQLSRTVTANVSFSNELGMVRKELEKSKKEARDLLKIVRKAEKDKSKKGKTQPQGTSLHQELSIADERDQNEVNCIIFCSLVINLFYHRYYYATSGIWKAR